MVDKSTKVVDAARKKLEAVKSAIKATKSFSNERAMLVFAVLDAEAEHRAALRQEKHPRANCAQCRRRFKSGEPVVWHWTYGTLQELCLRCDRRQHETETRRLGRREHERDLAELDQQPCETCARPMHFDRSSQFLAHRPLTCSYQCGYRRKIRHQLERKRVAPATIACVVCQEMFTPTRRDATTCGNTCRQKLFRRRAMA